MLQFDAYERLCTNQLGTNSALEPTNYSGNACRETFHELDHELLAQRVAGAYRLPFDLKRSQLTKLNELIAPLMALPDHDAIAARNFSQHGIAAAQHFIAADILKRWSGNEFGNHMNAISPLDDYHLPSQKMDGREDYRATKAVLSGLEFDQRLANYIHRTENWCGAEFNHDKTEKLVCNQVLFWLDMQSLFKLFHNKAVHQLKSAMIFPLGLLEGISTYDDLSELNFIVKGQECLMAFAGDDSIPYAQDLKTWQSYLRAGVKDGRNHGYNFNLLFEHYKWVGRICILSITRVQGEAKIVRFIPQRTDEIRITNWIPIMAELSNKLSMGWFGNFAVSLRKLAVAFRDAPHYNVPRQMLSEIDAFLLNRKDDAVDRQTAGIILTSKMYKIVVGSYALQKGHNMSLGDLADLVSLLLLRSYIARSRCTRVVGYASTNVVRLTAEKGFFSSLKELFMTPSLTAASQSANLARAERFAHEVMKTTPLHDAFRQFVLNEEKPVVDVYEEVARRHHITPVKLPRQTDFHYDPPVEGHCFNQCMAKVGAYIPLQKFPTEREVDNWKTFVGGNAKYINVNGGHATLEIASDELCAHSTPKTLYVLDRMGRKHNCTEWSDRRYLSAVGESNYHKTDVALQLLRPLRGKFFKGRKERQRVLVNACAAPCNDETVWQNYKGKVEHWIDTRYARGHLLPNYPAKQTYNVDKNLMCHECLSDVGGKDVFADLGADLPKQYLSAFQCTAMKNLRANAGKVVIKLQDFRYTMESGLNRAFLEELQHWWVFTHKALQANEVYAANWSIYGGRRFRPVNENELPESHRCEGKAPDTISLGRTFPVDDTEDYGRENYIVESSLDSRLAAHQLAAGKVNPLPSAPPLALRMPVPTPRNIVRVPVPLPRSSKPPQAMPRSLAVVQAEDAKPVRPGRKKDKQFEITARENDAQPAGVAGGPDSGPSVGAQPDECAASVTDAEEERDLYDEEEEPGELAEDRDVPLVTRHIVEWMVKLPLTRPESPGEVLQLDLANLLTATTVNSNEIPEIARALAEHTLVCELGDTNIVSMNFKGVVHDCYKDLPYDGVIQKIVDGKIHGPLYVEKEIQFHDAYIDLSREVHYDVTLKQALKETKGVHQKFHREVYNAIEDWKFKPGKYKIKLMDGTYACGKSYAIKQHIKKSGVKDYLIVSPTKNLAQAFKDDGYRAASWSAALLQAVAAEIEVFYIDELFLHDPRVVAFFLQKGRVTAVGDRRQMSPNLPAVTKLSEVTTKVPRYNISRTAALDVVMRLNETEPEPTYTRSKIADSLCLRSHGDVEPCVEGCEEKHEHVKMFCYDLKNSTKKGWNTVATSQGLRVEEFHLALTSVAGTLIKKIPSQTVVALTRAKQKTYLYCSKYTEQMAKSLFPSRKFCLCGRVGARSMLVGARTKFSTPHGYSEALETRVIEKDTPKFAAMSAGAVLKPQGRNRLELVANIAEQMGDVVTMAVPKEYVVNATHATGDIVPLQTVCGPDPKLVVDESGTARQFVEEQPTQHVPLESVRQCDASAASYVVATVAPTTSTLAGDIRNVNVLKNRELKPGRRMTVKTAQPLTEDYATSGVFQMGFHFGMNQNNSANHRIHTTVERYGVVQRQHLTDAEVAVQAEQLINGFAKFVDINALRPPTVEELEICRTQSLLRAAAKQNQKETGLWGELFSTTEEIKCFNKVQMKCKVGENSYINVKEADGLIYIKGGQMVSAQPKEVNQVVSPHINWAERIVGECLKPGVYLGYGQNPKALSRKLQIRTERRDVKMDSLSLDISEQDTTKNRAVSQLMRYIYGKCGVPDVVVQAVDRPNDYWRMDNLAASINVKGQFQSGRADTLASNTMHIIAETGRAYDVEGLSYALFQGDDCHIRATNIKRVNFEFANFKEDWSGVGEFVSFLVNNGKLFIDLVRVAAKCLSRNLKDNGRIRELQVAVDDCLSLINDTQTEYENIMVVSVKYGIGVGEAGLLLNYLRSFAREEEWFINRMKKKCGLIVESTSVGFDFEG
ncbi:replicase [Beihai tiger crab virus 1]|uniref:replicase n=1 Tax=Beihai tiger crab virus 1 TaxID=1922711 RepID=UPI000909CFCA|nr:replicase [Beihai tiger crab virus 1]APG77632.1 replicase [Beihai tiger crab virus 1]